jgi:hypothetical protein
LHRTQALDNTFPWGWNEQSLNRKTDPIHSIADRSWLILWLR